MAESETAAVDAVNVVDAMALSTPAAPLRRDYASSLIPRTVANW